MLEHQMVLQKWGREKAQGMYITSAVLAHMQTTNILIILAYNSVLIFL